ncbi:acetoacetate-CoA ligase [Phanerochaete sordida]|uniref:Acetoacetate-CoA ligase n=1 Tax=Phanerochaete sordida TaxID=48140 RepID=A0A9P3G9V0_9APHY|nr:acetoacetate-CoA ligase [Phanerochaete sordida]
MDSRFSQSRLIRTPKDPRSSRVEAFRVWVNTRHGLGLQNYQELHNYSVTDYTFWQDLWHYFNITYSVPPTAIVKEGRLPELRTWFPGARLNYAENVLRFNGDNIAVTAARETGHVAHYSFRELRRMVGEMAAAMRANGVRVGDRVAAVITNSVEALVVALATISIGAVFSSMAPDMGPQAILDRYGQVKPKLMFFDTEVVYAGKTSDLTQNVLEIVHGLFSDGLRRAVLLPSTKNGKEVAMPSTHPVCQSLADFLKSGDGRPLEFEQLPFDHPIFIVYSSGTTGPPKCIVHCAGGLLLNGMKEGAFASNLSQDQCFYQYTTTGWVVWNTTIPALACGTRIVLYDGSPFAPDIRSALKFINDQGVTVWGTSPRFFVELRASSIKPSEVAPFEALQTIACAGSPLTVPMFEWIQEAFGDVYLFSIYGCTDICGGFLTGVPNLPTHAGEIHGKALGMAVEIFDDLGESVEDAGVPGELVCTRPHPVMPLGFWGDSGDELLTKTYFGKYPGAWHQSDFAVKNPKTSGFVILGRSDGVLNPSGVRYGSAEIYGVLENLHGVISDALCIGQRRPQDSVERVLLFVKMPPGRYLDECLKARIRKAIRKDLSPRYLPAHMFQVKDIPYNANGKKVEVAVKRIVSGLNFKPSRTVVNPDCLKEYYKFRDYERAVMTETAEVKARL